jgi:hypothetical protein
VSAHPPKEFLAGTVELDIEESYQLAGSLLVFVFTRSGGIRRFHGPSMNEANANEKHKQNVFGSHG